MGRAFSRLWLLLCVLVVPGLWADECGLRFLEPDDCPGCGCGECCIDTGCFYFQLDALLLHRTNSSSQPVVIRVTDEGDATPGTTVLTTGSAKFNLQPSFAALLGWQVDDCRAWELAYFGIYNWNGSAVATGNNDLAIPGDLGLASFDFFAADRMRVDYHSTLNNAEFNAVRLIANDFWLLGGFRYVGLGEEFNLRSTDLDTGMSNYNIRTSNNLFGGQVGARWSRTRGMWDWSATAKAGIFGNDAQQRQIVSDFPPPFLLRDAGPERGVNVAFVADMNFSGVIHLDETWSLRAGYNLFWIEGVALATSQLDFADPPSTSSDVSTSGGFFAHGLNFGVEAIW